MVKDWLLIIFNSVVKLQNIGFSKHALDASDLVEVVRVAVWTIQVIFEELIRRQVCCTDLQSGLLGCESIFEFFRKFDLHLVAVPGCKMDYAWSESTKSCAMRVTYS
jgi:hypothetical protein